MTPQELKESILWNAIQGKFTTQFQTESIKEVLGKVHVSPVADEDEYFDIPRNWCWARIGEIFDLVNGKAFKPTDWSEQGIPIVRIQNLNDPNAPFNYFAGEIEEKYFLHGGELLFSWSGTPGTSFGAFIWDGGKAVLNQHIFIVYPKITLDYEYAKYALNGELRVFIAKAHGGAGLKHITRKEFDSCFLPIPPLAEQKRIVAKIEEILPLIDRYEQAWTKLEAFNKRFPADMQKSLLQLAIQGKLVDQRPEEGTGEDLYRQIQVEKQSLIRSGKLKKDKPLPEITEDEKPFDIPESWKWVFVGSVCVNIQYGSSSKSSTTGKMPVLRMGNIQGGRVIYDKLVFTSDDSEITKYPLSLNDLLFNRTNSKELVGKTAIYKGEMPAIYAGYLVRVTPVVLDSDYLNYVMQSQYYWNYCQAVRSDAIGQSNINAEKLKRFMFPLPPLAEQKRIVAKLESLLSLCERMKIEA